MPIEIVPLPPVEPTRGYSIPHVTLYLDTSAPGVYKLIHAGLLVSRKIGKRRIVPGSEIIRFLNGEPPTGGGDPIEPRMSELGRIGGNAGGLAKARKVQAGEGGRDKVPT